jgi:pyridoxal/pyridoxine/pyridoxamine kinase
MSYKKILTIQDISCVGQCSLTVALPILSACGIETCVLPSAVLSTHTAGFSGYTFRDLTEDMPAIKDHWVKEGIRFTAIYTGYLGSTKQIAYVADIFDATADEGCVKVVDPAMADNGKLYPGFDAEFVEAMKSLCAKADYIVPNITESVKVVTAKYTAEKLVGTREKLAQAIEEDLTARLREFNIELVSTSIEDMDFTDKYTNAVEAKQVAQQNKLKAETEAEQKVVEAKANAEVERIKAQGKADAKRIAAEAEADANKKIAASLDERVLKNKWYEKWDGKYPQVVSGGGTIIEFPMGE